MSFGVVATTIATGVITDAITGGSKKSSGGGGSASLPPERTAEQQLNDIVTIYFGPSAVGKYKGLYDPKLVSDLAKIDAKARKDLSVVELESLDLLLNGATTPNPAYQESRNKSDAFRSIERKLKNAGNKAGSQKFINSLTGGEKYYLYQGGYIDAAGVPRRSYGKLDIGGEAAKARREVNITPKTKTAPGLNQIVKEQSELIGDITRSETSKTRTADVEDLNRLGRQVTQAYRNADPASANLARIASERAGDFSESERDARLKASAFSSVQQKILKAGGNPRNKATFANAFRSQAFRDSLTDGEAYYLYQEGYINVDRTPQRKFDVLDFQKEVRDARTEIKNIQSDVGRTPDVTDKLNEVGSQLIGGDIREASAAERALEMKGMADVFSAREKASEAEKQLLSRGVRDLNAQREPATDIEKKLSMMGFSESDTSLNDAESLIFDRGSEFINSTGGLSPLEQRNTAQAARQASVARGRGMDQSSIYEEMMARSSEELDKKEREVALGSDLLSKQAEMRRLRLSQGSGFLKDAADLAEQRRQEAFERQQFGAKMLGQVDDMEARRINQQLQRQAMGVGALGTVDNMTARREQELLNRQQAGASMINTGESIESNRLNTAFDLNRRMAPDLGNVLLNRTSGASFGGLNTAQNIGSGTGYQVVDPNSGITMDSNNYANQINRAGVNAQIGANRSAGSSSVMSDVTSSIFNNAFDSIFDTKMDFGF